MTDKTEHERCAEMLRQILGPEPTAKIYTLTTYGSGETDYVRLFVATTGREIAEITYYAARAFGDAKITPGKGWPYRGAQYNKGLEAADNTWYAAFGHRIDQSRWEEL